MSDEIKDTPRRKGLGRKQLEWCRRWLRYEGAPVFAQMEKASKGARLVASKGRPK